MTGPQYDITIRAGRRTLVEVQAFPLEEGRVTILFGESGIGKSLIGKSLFGIADEESLRVRINGESYDRFRSAPGVRAWRKNGFFVFQEPSSHLNPLMTLGEQIREGDLADAPHPAEILQELWNDPQARPVESLLPVYPTPYRPSGGEKQRVLAGMAFEKMDLVSLAKEGAGGLFVFDEPTGSLDREARDLFLDRLMDRFRRRPVTVLLITHDYSMISHLRRGHPDVQRALRLLELTRINGKLRVDEFAPKRYLDWLSARRPLPPPSAAARPLLTVESGIEVFGRRFHFERGKATGTPEDLQVYPGDLVYLKAGSGVGKTTVVKIIMGLQVPEHFRMMIEGVRLGEVSPKKFWRNVLWGKKLTMAFQHADEALNPHATVDESLSILPSPALRTPEGRMRVLRVLFDDSAIASLRTKKVWQLSGGQKQRLNLLRAFSLSTPLVILDEPLNALDFGSIGRVLDLVEEHRRGGHAILLISHNEDIFDAVAAPERVYRLVASDS